MVSFVNNQTLKTQLTRKIFEGLLSIKAVQYGKYKSVTTNTQGWRVWTDIIILLALYSIKSTLPFMVCPGPIKN